MAEKILFLTGKLAERQLKRILKIMKPEFSYKISQVGVSVAALMSENIIMRRVSKDKEIDKIIVPGKFRGDLEKLSKFFFAYANKLMSSHCVMDLTTLIRL